MIMASMLLLRAFSSSCLASGIANRRLFLLSGGRFSITAASSPPLGLGKRALSSSSSQFDDGGSFDDIADPEPLDPESELEGKVKYVEFVAEEKDKESDESLWALYERWCKAFRQERDHEEMLRRFDYFKECVFHVDRANNEAIRNGDPCRLGINKFADGKLTEQQQFRVTFDSFFKDWPYAEPGTVILVDGSGAYEFIRRQQRLD